MLAALALSACDGDTGGPPTTMSKDEAQALEEAAEMLEAERPSEGGAPGPASETAPEPAP